MMYDVIVCGGGPSGICAAIGARRCGARVLLVEKSGLLGGANVLSLVAPLMAFHNRKGRIIGGLAEEIVAALKARGYSLGHVSDPIDFCGSITPFDVEGLKEVYFHMIKEEGVDVLFHAVITGLNKTGETINEVKAATKQGIYNLKARVFVDATGDGDVAYHSGAEYFYGRESDGLAQPMTMLFSVANIDFEKIKAYKKAHPEDFYKGDAQSDVFGMSGFFRMVGKGKAEGGFNIPRDRILLFENPHAGEATLNITRVSGYSGVDPFSLSQAEAEGRKQIREAFQFLKKYIPGFEQSYIIRTPEQIGVRETRHVVGEYLFKEEDIIGEKSFADSIALCAFPVDIHDPSGSGLYAKDEIRTYEIPMRVMFPVARPNLIVTGRAVSAVHEASASMRITPVVMALGQAAGVIAAVAARKRMPVKEIPYTDISSPLKKGRAVLKKADVV